MSLFNVYDLTINAINMKTKIIICISLILILGMACNKKDTDEYLTGVAEKLQGKWMITGYINDMGQDEYSSMPACEKDNVITYDKYTVSVDEGTFKCDPTDPQRFSSTFTLKEMKLICSPIQEMKVMIWMK